MILASTYAKSEQLKKCLNPFWYKICGVKYNSRKIPRFLTDLRMNLVFESVCQLTAVSMSAGMMMVTGAMVSEDTRVTRRSIQGTRAASPT